MHYHQYHSIIKWRGKSYDMELCAVMQEAQVIALLSPDEEIPTSEAHESHYHPACRLYWTI